jgi:hypothetical protein
MRDEDLASWLIPEPGSLPAWRLGRRDGGTEVRDELPSPSGCGSGRSTRWDPEYPYFMDFDRRTLPQRLW